MIIGIIGAGQWGLALASSLSTSSDVIVYCKNDIICTQVSQVEPLQPQLHSGRILATADIADIFENADVIIMAIPGNAFIEVMEKCKGYLALNEHRINKQYTFLSAAKTILDAKFTDEILAEYFQSGQIRHRVGVISGANLASEIMAGSSATCSIGLNMADDFEECKLLAGALSAGSRIQFCPFNDSKALAICGVMKNIAAIGAGFLVGQKSESAGSAEDGGSAGSGNQMADYMQRALKDIWAILHRAGCNDAAILEPAGAADLALSCYSGKTRNFKFGFDLAQMGKDELAAKYSHVTIEGVNNVQEMQKLDMAYGSYVIEMVSALRI